jgi:hypothetical protein
MRPKADLGPVSIECIFTNTIINIWTTDREAQSSGSLADRLRSEFAREDAIGPTRLIENEPVSEHPPTLLDRPKRTIKLTEKAR